MGTRAREICRLLTIARWADNYQIPTLAWAILRRQFRLGPNFNPQPSRRPQPAAHPTPKKRGRWRIVAVDFYGKERHRMKWARL
jgi:hypothetical protein